MKLAVNSFYLSVSWLSM